MHSNKLRLNERGFSIVELLIAIVIFSIAIGAAFSLLNQSLMVSNVSMQQTDAQQSLRIAQEYTTRDLYNTADGLRGFNPMIKRQFVSNYLSKKIVEYPNVNGVQDARRTENFVPLGMITADDEAANIAVLGTAPGTTILNGTDRITLLITPDIGSEFADIPAVGVREDDDDDDPIVYRSDDDASDMYVSSIDSNRVVNGDIFLLYNPDSSVNSAFVTVTGTANRNGNGNGNGNVRRILFDESNILNGETVNFIAENKATTPLALKRVWMLHYFVDNNNRLIRRVVGQRDVSTGQPFTDNIIAEHVTNLEFRHILREVYETANSTDPRNGEILPPEFLSNFVDNINVQEQLKKQQSVRQVEVTLRTETVRGINNNAKGEIVSSTVTSPRNLQFRESLEPGD